MKEKISNIIEAKRNNIKNDTNTIFLLDNSPKICDDYLSESWYLDSKIKDQNVRNIAIVARYGAGKSSAINTYISKFRANKAETYTRVSLSSFNDVSYELGEIERSILQQMLYSQANNKLPNSNIKRTNKSCWIKSIGCAFLITVMIVFIILFGLQVSNDLLFGSGNWFLKWIFLSAGSLSLLVLLTVALHYNKLRKIKYKDIEAEIVKETGDDVTSTYGHSLINKFIDEVLYFFECTKVDLVIFEDLDRLGKLSSKVFVKLRELNTIVNNSFKCKNKITFLYAVRDDIFENQEERSKFFEFILPIIPVINPNTTEERIREIEKYITDRSDKYKLDDEFINDISLFISDMRVLKNTFNDYVMMRSKVFSESSSDVNKLKNENLFAICLYKNLQPCDYSLLESNEGLIPIIFDFKYLSKIAAAKINTEKKELMSKISDEESESDKRFEECKEILKNYLSSLPLGIYATDLIPIQDIETFKNLNMGKIAHPKNQSYSVQIPNDDLKFEDGLTFPEKEQLLTDSLKSEKEKINNEIAIKEEKIKKLNSMKMQDYIADYGIDFCFDRPGDEGIAARYIKFLNAKNLVFHNKDADLFDSEFSKQLKYLRFLVKSGYLNENYLQYTSSYKSSLISPNDADYIMSIRSGTQCFDKHIDNVNIVIERVKIADFGDTVILNNALLQNMSVIKCNKKKFNKLRELLCSQKTEVLIKVKEFVSLNEDKAIIQLIREILKDGIKLVSDLLKSDLSDSKKGVIIQTIIQNADNYSDYNNTSVNDFFSSYNNWLDVLLKTDIIKAKKFILESKLKFINLPIDTQNEIVAYIISNDNYKINVCNIRLALSIPDLNEKSDFFTNNYKFIENKDRKVFDYINNNFCEYIIGVFTNAAIIDSDENSKAAISFLKNQPMSNEAITKISEKFSFCIDNVKDYKIEIRSPLFQSMRVKFSWDNILDVYKISGFKFIKSVLLKNVEKISGILEDESLFSDIINDEYNPEELPYLETISKRIERSFKLNKNYKNDNELSIFIKSGCFSYNNTDFEILLNKSVSLNEYLRKFSKDVLLNFETFFKPTPPGEITLRIFLDKNISYEMKRKILDGFGTSINISGFEEVFLEEILNKYYDIPICIFEQIIKSNKINLEMKLLSMGKVEPSINDGKKTDYIEKIIPELVGYENKAQIIISTTNEMIIQSVKLFAKVNKYVCSTKKDKIVLKRKIHAI